MMFSVSSEKSIKGEVIGPHLFLCRFEIYDMWNIKIFYQNTFQYSIVLKKFELTIYNYLNIDL